MRGTRKWRTWRARAVLARPRPFGFLARHMGAVPTQPSPVFYRWLSWKLCDWQRTKKESNI